jgi:hypothetical protein
MKVSEFRKLIHEEVRKVIKESTVSSVMTKHQQALLKALTARKRNQEDEDAHDAVEAELQAIAKELRLDPTIPFMEDEMFSGSESPKDAYKYAIEMFTDMVEEKEDSGPVINYGPNDPLRAWR